MKSLKRVLGIALVLVLLGSGTSWAAYFDYTSDTFTSNNGHWISATGGATWNWNAGFSGNSG